MSAEMECENLDPSAGLLKPCWTANISTLEHWCLPCVVSNLTRPAILAEVSRRILSDDKEPNR